MKVTTSYVILVSFVYLLETAEVDNAVFGKMTSKDLIVMLSTSANIVSRHTSFVGVDKVRYISLVHVSRRRCRGRATSP